MPYPQLQGNIPMHVIEMRNIQVLKEKTQNQHVENIINAFIRLNWQSLRYKVIQLYATSYCTKMKVYCIAIEYNFHQNFNFCSILQALKTN